GCGRHFRQLRQEQSNQDRNDRNDHKQLSTTIRAATISPLSAFFITALQTPSAWPSNISSASRVAWLRAPTGLPAGLPLVPLGHGRPPCFRAVVSVISNKFTYSNKYLRFWPFLAKMQGALQIFRELSPCAGRKEAVG